MLNGRYYSTWYRMTICCVSISSSITECNGPDWDDYHASYIVSTLSSHGVCCLIDPAMLHEECRRAISEAFEWQLPQEDLPVHKVCVLQVATPARKALIRDLRQRWYKSSAYRHRQRTPPLGTHTPLQTTPTRPSGTPQSPASAEPLS